VKQLRSKKVVRAILAVNLHLWRGSWWFRQRAGLVKRARNLVMTMFLLSNTEVFLCLERIQFFLQFLLLRFRFIWTKLNPRFTFAVAIIFVQPGIKHQQLDIMTTTLRWHQGRAVKFKRFENFIRQNYSRSIIRLVPDGSISAKGAARGGAEGAQAPPLAIRILMFIS